MNGIPTRSYRARATASYTIFGVAKPGTMVVALGNEYDVIEDHYGNVYTVENGVEFSLTSSHIERIDEGRWHRDGAQARVEYLRPILDRTERPVGGDHRKRLEQQVAEAEAVVAEHAGR